MIDAKNAWRRTLDDIRVRFEDLKDMLLVRIGKRRKRQGPSPIVPDGSVTGTALVIVIAIMTFLACLTMGGVTLVRASAAAWQSQIAREATIQIRPVDGQDMERRWLRPAKSRVVLPV